MIIGNYSLLAKNTGRSPVANASKGINFMPSITMNFFTSGADAGRIQYSSTPTGTEPSYSRVFAPKGGEMSTTTSIYGTGSLTSPLSMGITMSADLSGTSDLTVAVGLITSIQAALSGTGDLSVNLSLTLDLAAALIGSGDVSAALNLLIPLEAALSGSGALTLDLKGNADMASNIYVNQSDATVEQIVNGVWNAVASQYNVSGTMGEKLNAAGTAGDPWTTDLSSYNTTGTAGKIMKQIKVNTFAAL